MHCFLQLAEEELVQKQEELCNLNNTGQKILSKPGLLSYKSRCEVEAKLARVQEKWQEISLPLTKKIAAIEEKLSRATKFLEELEELSVWMSATRDLLEKQERGDAGVMIDPEVIAIVFTIKFIKGLFLVYDVRAATR